MKPKIGAIAIDTSIIKGYNFDFENGLLKKLNQFEDLPIDIVFTNIVFNEMTVHLADQIENSKNELIKSLRRSEKHLPLSSPVIQNLNEELTKLGDSKRLSIELIQNFYRSINAKIVDDLKFTDLKKVLKNYFNKLPPFNESKKKSEFPDALALIALENYAIENEYRILAISKDGDWRRFCEHSDQFEFSESLADAFKFLEPDPEVVKNLSRFEEVLTDDTNSILYRDFDNKLGDIVNMLDVYPEASSSYFFETDWNEVRYLSFQIIKNSIKPIYHQDNVLSIKMDVEIETEADTTFHFSVRDSIDKDYVNIGESAVTVDFIFETELLVEIEGNLSLSDEGEVFINRLELLRKPSMVDFGDVEPDWSEGNFN